MDGCLATGFASKSNTAGGMFTAQVNIPRGNPVRPPTAFGGLTCFTREKYPSPPTAKQKTGNKHDQVMFVSGGSFWAKSVATGARGQGDAC
jgi:hypothetical protein